MHYLLIFNYERFYLVGINKNNNGHPIEIKKHGRKAFSLFKFGLIFLAHTLLNPLSINDLENCIKILSCTYRKYTKNLVFSNINFSHL